MMQSSTSKDNILKNKKNRSFINDKILRHDEDI